MLQIIQVKIEELELEILDLQKDIVLKSNVSDENSWNIVDRNKFSFWKRAAYKIQSFFGSTYLCESFFATMNIIKSKDISRLTGKHLDIAYEQKYHHTLPITKQLPMKRNTNDHIDFEIYVFFIKNFHIIIYYLLFILHKNIFIFYNYIFFVHYVHYYPIVKLPWKNKRCPPPDWHSRMCSWVQKGSSSSKHKNI